MEIDLDKDRRVVVQVDITECPDIHSAQYLSTFLSYGGLLNWVTNKRVKKYGYVVNDTGLWLKLPLYNPGRVKASSTLINVIQPSEDFRTVLELLGFPALPTHEFTSEIEAFSWVMMADWATIKEFTTTYPVDMKIVKKFQDWLLTQKERSVPTSYEFKLPQQIQGRLANAGRKAQKQFRTEYWENKQVNYKRVGKIWDYLNAKYFGGVCEYTSHLDTKYVKQEILSQTSDEKINKRIKLILLERAFEWIKQQC